MNNNELDNEKENIELNSNDSFEKNLNDTYMDGLGDEDSYEEMQSVNPSNNNLSNYNQEQIQNKIRNVNRNQNAAQRLRQRNSNTLGKKVESNHSTSSNNEENTQESNELENQNKEDKLTDKLNPTNKLKNIGNNAKNAVKQKSKEAGKAVVKGVTTGIKALATNPATAPAFWTIMGVLILVIMVPVFISILEGDSKNSGSTSNNNNVAQSVNSTISLTYTNLSRSEFVEACNNRSSIDSSHKLFYDKCGRIYDISKENNFNPEMVVIRAHVEGFSPGDINNNYWGIGCYNNGGVKACKSYASFDEGVKAFIANVSQYKSVEEMMSRYAYIGDNWYNPGSSSNGGCYYFPYLRKYLSSSRDSQVEGYCSSNRMCSGTSCQPTNSEDQYAYSKYQVESMVDAGNLIFGGVTSGIGGTFANGFAIRTATDKPNWLSTPDSNYYTKSISSDPFQCVWYAKARAYEIISTMSGANETRKQEAIDAIFSTGGNGSQWYNNAISNTPFSIFESSNDYTKPRPGAMISWEWDSNRWANSKKVCSENCGHVAIIESVDEENRTVVISDGWKRCGNWNSLDCLGYGSRTVSYDNIPTFNNNGYVFKGYVYIADYVIGGN